MKVSLTLCVFLLLVACGDAGEVVTSSSESNGTAVRVGTFNAGLARGYVDHAALRFPAQLEALRSLDDVDVLCLQEVWQPEDRDMIIDQLSDVFPHAHYQNSTNAMLFPDAEQSPAACTEAEADPLAECARPVCEDDPDIATCVLSECGDLFDALSAGCQECAASNIGLGSIDSILSTCLTAGSVGYSYDGQNGLLLLSTATISNPRFQQFDAFLTARGVLLGNTHGIEVGCTHLTSNLSDPVYSGDYASYGDENAAQVDALLDLFSDDEGSAPQVLAGDFNTGPMTEGLSDELPESYAKFPADGWANPNMDSDMPMCTWCDANLITGGSANEAIDHVFVRGATADDPIRFLDLPLELRDSDGNAFETSYSDHFGLSVRLLVPPI